MMYWFSFVWNVIIEFSIIELKSAVKWQIMWWDVESLTNNILRYQQETGNHLFAFTLDGDKSTLLSNTENVHKQRVLYHSSIVICKIRKIWNFIWFDFQLTPQGNQIWLWIIMRNSFFFFWFIRNVYFHIQSVKKREECFRQGKRQSMLEKVFSLSKFTRRTRQIKRFSIPDNWAIWIPREWNAKMKEISNFISKTSFPVDLSWTEVHFIQIVYF